jgi:Sec-independent protein translocase protein TatA
VTVLALLDIGFGELLLCAVVALLLFGGRLPEAMGRFGAVYRNFRRGVDDLKRTIDSQAAPPKPPARYRPAPNVPLSQGIEAKAVPPGVPGPARAPVARGDLVGSSEPPPAPAPAPKTSATTRAAGSSDDAPPV